MNVHTQVTIKISMNESESRGDYLCKVPNQVGVWVDYIVAPVDGRLLYF